MALDPVTSALSVVDDGIKVATQKDAQLNTQAEVQATIAAEVQKLKDQIKAAIEKGDIESIRLLCA